MYASNHPQPKWGSKLHVMKFINHSAWSMQCARQPCWTIGEMNKKRSIRIQITKYRALDASYVSRNGTKQTYTVVWSAKIWPISYICQQGLCWGLFTRPWQSQWLFPTADAFPCQRVPTFGWPTALCGKQLVIQSARKFLNVSLCRRGYWEGNKMDASAQSNNAKILRTFYNHNTCTQIGYQKGNPSI